MNTRKSGHRPRLSVLSAKSWRISTFFATGVWPQTSPPTELQNFEPMQIEADIVYIRLHGFGQQPYLYGDEYLTALSAKQISEAPVTCFSESVVFLEGCYGAGMAKAFLSAGASAVIGNTDPTWSRAYTLGPASKVGNLWLRRFLAGNSVELSLVLAISKLKPPYNQGWEIFGNKEYVYHERKEI